MMLTEPVRLWLAALRSGQYKQIRNRLAHREAGAEGYCCLGVACEVYIQAGGVLSKHIAPNGHIFYDGQLYNLPDDVLKWLGLTDRKGQYTDPVEHSDSALAAHNDGGVSFARIADIIESAPDGLFVEAPHDPN